MVGFHCELYVRTERQRQARLYKSAHLITQDRDADLAFLIDTGVIDLGRERDLRTKREQDQPAIVSGRR